MSEWIRSIICVAVFCTIALALTPKGRVKSAEKLICAAIMIFAVFSPFIGFDATAYAASAAKYAERGKALAAEGKESGERLYRTLIEQELRAYIWDKAENIGARINDISIEVAWSDEGYWYPISVKLTGSFSDYERERLSAVIASELGVQEDGQSWIEVSE